MSLNPKTQAVEMAVGSARGKLRAAVEPVAIADLKRVSVEIHQAMLELHKLVTGREIEPRWQRRDA
jgi:hypothetical protein